MRRIHIFYLIYHFKKGKKGSECSFTFITEYIVKKINEWIYVKKIYGYMDLKWTIIFSFYILLTSSSQIDVLYVNFVVS